MAYATLAKVKERCRIKQSDSQHDDELNRAIVYGDLWVDMLLGRYDLSGTGNATLATETASDFAAYYYMRNRGQSDDAMKYREDALELLSAYIFANTGQVLRTRGPPIPTDLETSEI
jgi:phage gp36-like protein